MHKINRAMLYSAILVLVLAKTTFLSNFRIYNTLPDIVMIAVVFLGLNFGERIGLEAGLAAGFLNDALSAMGFGLGVFGYGLIGFFCGITSKRVYKESFVTQFLFCFLAALLFSFSAFSIKAYHLPAPAAVPNFAKSIFSHAIYTGIAAPLFFLLLFKLFKIKESRL